MKFSSTLLLIASCVVSTTTNPLEFNTIKAEGIEASYLGYGARLASLKVRDRHGDSQDIILGHDTGEEYIHDTLTNHTYYGAVVGRYANRIRNGTFSIDGEVYHVPTNEHDGADTLHGSFIGYDQRNWTVVAHDTTSITFRLYDNNFEHFPGQLISYATYTVTGENKTTGQKPALTTRLISIPLDKATPVMLSTHNYWNLNAFVNPADYTVLNDTLHMPNAKRYIKTDMYLDPTGLGVVKHTGLDFTVAKTIGRDLKELKGVCGPDCIGYDTAFILDGPHDVAQITLSSPQTGIQMEYFSNQPGIQIFTCDQWDSTIKVKKSHQHGNSSATVPQYGCIVIEPQDWIDGINMKEWGREAYQVFSPATLPPVNYARYEFSTF
ncbi:hypothetical protein TRVA0_025S01882 [Trichomonascus vanleenenianus]|uniref:aldose epimerase family protein n=1 Tax=Trichomonascus vanleenenianus TaxID=2268995 RepID=UPI003ECAE7DE